MVAGGSGVRLGASADQVVEHYAAAPEVYTRARSLPMTEFAIDALAAAQAVIPAGRDRLFRGAAAAFRRRTCLSSSRPRPAKRSLRSARSAPGNRATTLTSGLIRFVAFFRRSVVHLVRTSCRASAYGIGSAAALTWLNTGGGLISTKTSLHMLEKKLPGSQGGFHRDD